MDTQNITIAESMKRLNEKERMIINKRFWRKNTNRSCRRNRISQAQVSRLERTAINHILREYINKKYTSKC